MNSKERVNLALDRKEPDRVPFGEWGVDHDTVEHIIGRPSLWRNRRQNTLLTWAGKRDELVEGWMRDIVDLVKAVDYDLVPVFLVPPKDIKPSDIKQVDAENWQSSDGRIFRYSAANDDIRCISAPKQEKQVESIDEFRERFEESLVPGSGFKLSRSKGKYKFKFVADDTLELVRHVVKTLGKEKFVFARGFHGGFELPYFGGMEQFFITLATNPELVRGALAMLTDLDIALADVFIKEGVDCVMGGADMSDSNGPMASPQCIRGIYLPEMKRFSVHAKKRGVRVMSHNCGNNIKIMDILIESGMEAWQSIQAVLPALDMKRLKNDYGAKLTLWGGINIETLHDGTPEDNRRDVL